MAGAVAVKPNEAPAQTKFSGGNMKGLSPELIDKLMANSRSRNTYGPKLKEFIDSDEAGINPAEVWIEFKNKQASTMYQGFMKAVKEAKLEDTILVKQSDGAVFILNKEKIALLTADTDE